MRDDIKALQTHDLITWAVAIAICLTVVFADLLFAPLISATSRLSAKVVIDSLVPDLLLDFHDVFSEPVGGRHLVLASSLLLSTCLVIILARRARRAVQRDLSRTRSGNAPKDVGLLSIAIMFLALSSPFLCLITVRWNWVHYHLEAHWLRWFLGCHP